MLTEIIGIIAAIIVAASMCFRTTTLRGTVLLRSVNMLGSLIFIIYGLLLPAYSTALLNIAAIIINSYRLVKDTKKQKKVKILEKSS